jgi:pyridoxamine 5'-phosphate oxidase
MQFPMRSPAHLQVQLEAQVTILTGQDVAAIWAGVPEASTLSYGTSPAPGQPIAQAPASARILDPASSAVLRLSVSTTDALHLGPNHRRALFDRLDGWAGEWLAP